MALLWLPVCYTNTQLYWGTVSLHLCIFASLHQTTWSDNVGNQFSHCIMFCTQECIYLHHRMPQLCAVCAVFCTQECIYLHHRMPQLCAVCVVFCTQECIYLHHRMPQLCAVCAVFCTQECIYLHHRILQLCAVCVVFCPTNYFSNKLFSLAACVTTPPTDS